MERLITISPSPHIHSKNSTKKLMYGVIFSLLPTLFISVFYFGLGAFIITMISVITCVLAEYIITKYLLKQEPSIKDGSAVLTGLLLAFNVPSNIPVWIIMSGAIIAIGVAKLAYGGLGNNIFNPALVGRVFMLISFPVQMTSWPLPVASRMSYLDAQTGATPLGLIKEGIKSGQNLSSILASHPEFPNTNDLLLGFHGGSLGEIAIAAILIGFVYMLVRKIITWHIPVTIIATVLLFTGILNYINPDSYMPPIFCIFSGGLMLGAVYMATDYVTSPMSKNGMIIYGVGIGVITVVIRNFGSYPEGISFAILIMNAFTPLINRYLKPNRFGKEVKNG